MADNEYLRTVVDGLVCDMDNVKSSLAELYRRSEERDPSIENLEIDVNNNRTLSYRLESEIIHNTEKLDMLLNQAKFINDAERKYSLLEMKLNFIMNKLGLKNNEEKELLQ